MSGDPYRQAAEELDEVHGDVEQFRRALARDRQSTIFAIGYAVVMIASFVALPEPINLVVSAAINVAVAVALALMPKAMLFAQGRRASQRITILVLGALALVGFSAFLMAIVIVTKS